MNVSSIGEQIARYRKQKGLTQEELGRRVGVSTQAVSRWECGGAPDVTLLPLIADSLDVSIDALFGREGGSYEQIEKQFIKNLSLLSEDVRMERIVRFLFDTGITTGLVDMLDIIKDFPPNAVVEQKDTRCMLDALFYFDGGIMHGTCSKEFSCLSAFAEPKQGYRHFFDSNDGYRSLFAALAQPHTLEVLMDMASRKMVFITPAAEAKWLLILEEAARAAMEALADAHILERRTLEQGNGPETVYHLNYDRPIVPFFIFARLLGQEVSPHLAMVYNREKPILSGAEEECT